MPLNETQQTVLSEAIIHLISKIWDKDLYQVINEKKLAGIDYKTTAIRFLRYVILGSHDPKKVLKELEKINEESEDLSTEQIDQEYLKWLKGITLHMGFVDDDELNSGYNHYTTSPFYTSSLELKGLYNATQEAFLSIGLLAKVVRKDSSGKALYNPDGTLQYDVVEKLGPVPTLEETRGFIIPFLEKIQIILTDKFIQDNIIEKMKYIKDICEEIFYPDQDTSLVPELILKIMHEASDTNRAENLEKAVQTFYMNVDQAKLTALKLLYSNIYQVREQLHKVGYDEKELTEAHGDFKNIKQLAKDKTKNPFKGAKGSQELDIHLAAAFAIDTTGFKKFGTTRATVDINDRFKHFSIAKNAYSAYTNLSTSDESLQHLLKSDIDSIAKLAETAVFEQGLLKQVQTGMVNSFAGNNSGACCIIQ